MSQESLVAFIFEALRFSTHASFGNFPMNFLEKRNFSKVSQKSLCNEKARENPLWEVMLI